MISPQHYARICGALYIIIIACGVFAEAFVRGSLVFSRDAAATATHIMAHQQLWRLGLASEVLMLMCDVAVAIILYLLLRPVDRPMALLGAVFRLVQVSISGLNGLNHLAALLLLSSPPGLEAFSPAQLQAAALFSIRLQSSGYDIALVFFGVDCMIIGYLIFKSQFLPWVIGQMMALAGVCYFASSFSSIMSPPIAKYLFSHGVLLPPFIAELSFAAWLLIMGVNVPRWTAMRDIDRSAAVPLREG